MNLSKPFINRPVATSLLMLGLVLVGAFAFTLLPVAPLPQVDFPTIRIDADLPGASAETMAPTVATPLERALSDISGISSMTSPSSLGTTSITIQFDLSRNIDAAAQDLQTAINAAGGKLPKALPSPPTYYKVNPADFTILSLALTSDTLALPEIDRYADDLIATQILQISGVGLVDFPRRAEAGSPRADQSGQDRPAGLEPRRRAGDTIRANVLHGRKSMSWAKSVLPLFTGTFSETFRKVPDRVQIDTTLVRQNRVQNHALIRRHRLLNRAAVTR